MIQQIDPLYVIVLMLIISEIKKYEMARQKIHLRNVKCVKKQHLILYYFAD